MWARGRHAWPYGGTRDPGQARVMCWAPRPGLAPWKLDPNPTPARLFLAVHPSRMPQSRGLAKPQMFRTLTQCLCVLHRGLMWPQRWSWNCSDLCVVLGFHPCFQGEAGGSTLAQGFLSWSAQPVGTCPVSGASGKGGGGGGSGLGGESGQSSGLRRLLCPGPVFPGFRLVSLKSKFSSKQCVLQP